MLYSYAYSSSAVSTKFHINQLIMTALYYLFSTTIPVKEAHASGVDQCCRRHKIPELCVQSLCNPLRPPSDFDVYDIFERRNDCSKHLKQIAQCLADGRDHSGCCSREAKDFDENACFGMCKGDGWSEHQHTWSKYQTCLAINLPSMFNCFEKGYRTSPSPPQHLSIGRIEATEVELSWNAPAINSDLVDHYVIYLYEQKSDGNVDYDTETLIETVATHTRLSSLEPGTKYAANVVSVASSNDGPNSARSLASTMVHFQTAGIAPRVLAFKPKVFAPKSGASGVLACRFKVSGGVIPANLQVKWQRKNSPNDFSVLEGTRYNSSYYQYSENRPLEFIATLQVKAMTAGDFGVYRCTVSDSHGSGHAEVELAQASLQSPRAEPPETPLQCCASRGVQTRCLSMCGAEARYVFARPFMPSNCSSEISKVLSCAMPAVDDSECCLRQKVPRQCMFLCDSSIASVNQMSALCIPHINSVMMCRVDGVDKRPSNVQNLKAHSANDGTGNPVLVRWDAATHAEIYHIYWRRSSAVEWQQKSLVTTTKKLVNADEIVVIAANSYGISQAIRLKQADSGKWERA